MSQTPMNTLRVITVPVVKGWEPRSLQLLPRRRDFKDIFVVNPMCFMVYGHARH